MEIPQIAPLIWNLIFLTTSLVLIVTLVKVYFILNDKEMKEREHTSQGGVEQSNKTWIW